MDKKYLSSLVRHLHDWPKKGIIFPDVTTLLKDKEGFNQVINDFYLRYKPQTIDVVVGIDARGFIIGGTLAYLLNTGFVPARKKGKLPAETVQITYQLEYGTDTLEMHKDAISPGQKVLLVDDVLATGGTALATSKLIEKLGGQIVEFGFVINLPKVGGENKIRQQGYDCYTQINFIYD